MIKKMILLGVLQILALGIYAQDISFSDYQNQTEISATKSITFTDGFYVPAGANFRAFITDKVPLTLSASQNQNYIISGIIRKQGVKLPGDFSGLSIGEVNYTVHYFDGLGRSLQGVIVQGSPGLRDVVVPQTYDPLGRENLKYLPYTALGIGNGAYHADGVSAQNSFYNNPSAAAWSAPGVASIANSAFSETRFEPTPLNRVQEQGAPGADWQLSAGHTKKMVYGINNSLTNYAVDGYAVRLYKAVIVTGAGHEHERSLLPSGFYDAGQLQLTISKDENWIAAYAKAGTVEEYKNKEGQLVLTRRFNKLVDNTIEVLSTYYVYDDFGSLSFVLPPGVNPDNGSVSSSALNDFCYQYRYDGRKRLIEKWVPGKTNWTSTVYNQMDQVVLNQDPNQKDGGKWSYTKYDGLGRVIMIGIYTSSVARATLQGQVDQQSVLYEGRSSTADYGNLTFPQSGTELYAVNYYDDYSFPGGTTYTFTGASNRTRGMLTGTNVKVLDGITNVMLLGINYYDGDGRPVKTFKQHYLSGAQNTTNYDETLNTFAFSGELLTSTRVHHAGSVATTIANRYTYDHIGRKISTMESINGAGEVVLNKLDYNEIGQVVKKSVHSTDNGVSFLQFTSYVYNERGWLKKNTSDQFSLELQYQDNAAPQYNGNISGQLWGAKGTNTNIYAYNYDPLNRLLKGASTGVVMNEALTYDRMGNISTLSRDGGVAGQYTYAGNRLTQVTGGPLATGVYSYDASGNSKVDGRTGVSLTYNSLNLPATATKTGLSLAYVYDAGGNKLKKVSNGTARNYIGGIEYNGAAIDIIQTEEGVARNNGGTYSYEYNLTDHLGNVRYSFNKHPVTAQVQRLQGDDYYAFGKRKSVSPVSLNNKYLYNGKELQEELGQLDYVFRFYDPEIGRWNVVDPMSESHPASTPYHYVFNNPINYIDPFGLDTVNHDHVVPPAPGVRQMNEDDVIRLRLVTANGEAKPKAKAAFNSILTELQQKYDKSFGGLSRGYPDRLKADAANIFNERYIAHNEINPFTGQGRVVGLEDANWIIDLAAGGAYSLLKVGGAEAVEAAAVAGEKALTQESVKVVEETVVHGNSLKSLKPTWGYKLYSQDGTFLKNGITSAAKAESRYTKAFMSDKVMDKFPFPNRLEAYQWEFGQNQILRGPLNLNMH